MIDGVEIGTEYARYESDFVNGKIEKGAEIIEYNFGGKTLTLNLDMGTREE